MGERKTPKEDALNRLRSKFDMDNGFDVACWDYLNKINKVPIEKLILDFVGELKEALLDIEKEIEFFEKQRLGHLSDRVSRRICGETLVNLRKERDGLRETIGSETYQRVAAGSGSRAVQSRR